MWVTLSKWFHTNKWHVPTCCQLAIAAGNTFTFLLDAGWDETFDETALTALREAAPRVDAVLLSHPDLEHLGALPLLLGRFGLQVCLSVWGG